MGEVHHVIRKEAPLEKTINIKKLVGKKVLSKGGKIIGRVSEIRLNPSNCEIEGILIKRDIFRKPIYIGKSYFSHLSHEAILLNMEPSILIKNSNVIDGRGKIVGKVFEVVRKGNTNEIKELVVKSVFSKKFIIPPSAIKYLGKSIVLKPSYNVQKKYFWQRSK